jgi:hypothetical protein
MSAASQAGFYSKSLKRQFPILSAFDRFPVLGYIMSERRSEFGFGASAAPSWQFQAAFFSWAGRRTS